MHTTSFASLLLSILAIRELDPCFTSSINKRGWMSRWKSWLRHRASPPQDRERFDRYCKHVFLNCLNSYNDYSQPLLVPDDFMNYLYLSKRIFPQQWEFLATTRGICSRDGDDLQDYKER